MKVVVDLNRCQAYAQCVYAAPDHFALEGAEVLVYDPAPGDAARAEIERAVQACPVRAITAFPDAAPGAA
ncbi:ferredoxin [Methylobacterium oryzihabitans]|uniref:Ferredoxin n=1 Tax=Methylobacterium oryzihabitans TaxID=2499852 RepID=A0A3S2V6A5_9HYPH|nr:ferredoxin [Methylobacterium oryzihabitans]RVU15444.1 ferredoxin [Methylobacterium oryzihabitans]